MTSLLLHKMYKITSKWIAAPPLPPIPLTHPNIHICAHTNTRTTFAPLPSRSSSFAMMKVESLEYRKKYKENPEDYGKSDGPIRQTHGQCERDDTSTHFSITEQLKMNKNTLFTHVRPDLVQHAIYCIQTMLVHIPLYRKYNLRDQIVVD